MPTREEGEPSIARTCLWCVRLANQYLLLFTAHLTKVRASALSTEEIGVGTVVEREPFLPRQ